MTPVVRPARAVSRKLKRAQFAANVRVVQQLDREALELLLRHQLPTWVKVGYWGTPLIVVIRGKAPEAPVQCYLLDLPLAPTGALNNAACCSG